MPKIGNTFLKSNRNGPATLPVRSRIPGNNQSFERAVAAAVRRSEGKFFDNEASDTDSMASSNYSGMHGRKTGVSPLNRRKSLRLAVKQNSEMQVTQLLSQNTVVMKTPESQSLQRMETGSRWTGHRSNRLKSQETLIIPTAPKRPVKLTKGVSKWINYRKEVASQPSSVISKRPRLLKDMSRSNQSQASCSSVSLLKKKSTTWGIRQLLGATCLKQIDEVGTGTSQVNVGLDEPDSGKVDSKRNKRKRVGSLQPIAEESAQKLRVKKEVTFVSSASTSSPSAADKSPRKSALKRRRSRSSSNHSLGQLSVTEDEGVLHKTKRLCIDRNNDEGTSGPVFIANKRDWPVSMEAQVVWRLDVTDGGEAHEESKCVFVNTERCLVGTTTGNVLELDANVVPSRSLTLPSGVNCLKSVGKSIYAGCVDGAVYDISGETTGLLWKDEGFKEIKHISCSSDKIAVIDCHGKVAVISNKGETLWKEEKFLKEGVSVHIDDTGVYISHMNRLTKYSLDGNFVWGISGLAFTSTDATADELYTCSSGDVHKIDKYAKGQTLLSYNKGKEEVGYVNQCAVGGGLVFAAGRQLVCYDEKSGDVVYNMKLPSSDQLISIQYFQMRLFCLFTHSLEVLDFTEQSIITGKEGHQISTTVVSLPTDLHKQLSMSSVASAASSVNSHTEEDGNDLDRKPKARRGKLKVKATSMRKSARN